MRSDYLNWISLACELSIGAVQSLSVDGAIVELPQNTKALRDTLKFFGGDVYRFLQSYYRAASNLPAQLKCDVVRLFDATQIWSGCFDEDDPRYRKYVLDATDHLIDSETLFEVRIREEGSHGELPILYPSVLALRRIGERRGRVALTVKSDTLPILYLKNAMILLRSCGIGSVFAKKGDGWVQYSI